MPFLTAAPLHSTNTSAGTYYGLGMLRWPRSIGGIVANITVSEEARDDLGVTEHPVESNAPISDHAYLIPSQVVIRAGWSNSRPEANGDRTYARQMYDKLLQLQAARQPFDIITGKRKYTNMLIRSLIQTTDKESEEALIVTIIAVQVLIVTTKKVQVPDMAKSSQSDQLGDPVQGGPRQLVPKEAGTIPYYTGGTMQDDTADQTLLGEESGQIGTPTHP